MSSAKPQYRRVLDFIPFFLVGFVIIAYQNCGEFGSLNGSSAVGSLGGKPTPRNEPPGLYAADAQDKDLQTAAPIYVGFTYNLRLGGLKFLDAALLWQVPAATNTGTCALGEMPEAMYRTLKCTKPGRVVVNVTAVLKDGTVENYSMDRQVSGDAPTATPDPDIFILFNIAAGTGTGSWNAGAPIKAVVGKTIRFTNKDTINHQLSTGGAPCASSGVIAPNAFYDCVISGEHAAAATDMFDTIAGTGAVVYVQSINGDTQYANKCQGCHMAVDVSAKRNKTAAQIRTAIMNNAGGVMGGVQATDDELAAIQFALSH